MHTFPRMQLLHTPYYTKQILISAGVDYVPFSVKSSTPVLLVARTLAQCGFVCCHVPFRVLVYARVAIYNANI